jgi:hypothetical protein
MQSIIWQPLAATENFCECSGMRQISDKQVARLEALLVTLQEVVDELNSEGDKITPELIQRIEKYREERKCLYCSRPLEDEEVRRGCHQGCYNLVMGRMKNGEVSRADVIANGWFNPRTEKPGRKSKRPDPMRSAIAMGHEIGDQLTDIVRKLPPQSKPPSKPKRPDKKTR